MGHVSIQALGSRPGGGHDVYIQALDLEVGMMYTYRHLDLEVGMMYTYRHLDLEVGMM